MSVQLRAASPVWSLPATLAVIESRDDSHLCLRLLGALIDTPEPQPTARLAAAIYREQPATGGGGGFG